MKDGQLGIRAWALIPTAASLFSFLITGKTRDKGPAEAPGPANEAVNKCSLRAEP